MSVHSTPQERHRPARRIVRSVTALVCALSLSALLTTGVLAYALEADASDDATQIDPRPAPSHAFGGWLQAKMRTEAGSSVLVFG